VTTISCVVGHCPEGIPCVAVGETYGLGNPESLSRPSPPGRPDNTAGQPSRVGG